MFDLDLHAGAVGREKVQRQAANLDDQDSLAAVGS
jgi:hypothetical protein